MVRIQELCDNGKPAVFVCEPLVAEGGSAISTMLVEGYTKTLRILNTNFDNVEIIPVFPLSQLSLHRSLATTPIIQDDVIKLLKNDVVASGFVKSAWMDITLKLNLIASHFGYSYTLFEGFTRNTVNIKASPNDRHDVIAEAFATHKQIKQELEHGDVELNSMISHYKNLIEIAVVSEFEKFTTSDPNRENNRIIWQVTKVLIQEEVERLKTNFNVILYESSTDRVKKLVQSILDKHQGFLLELPLYDIPKLSYAGSEFNLDYSALKRGLIIPT